MSFELSIGNPGILNIIYMGTINGEQISSVRENAVAMINANKLNNILCDIRDASINMEIADLLNFAASSKSVYSDIKKTALVYDPENTGEKDLQLYRDTAQENGFTLRFFDNSQEARAWLEQ